MTDRLDKPDEDKYCLAKKILDFCRDTGVHQLTFRRVTTPDNHQSPGVANWISKHAYDDDTFSSFTMLAKRSHKKYIKLIRTLGHGVTVWDLDGIGVSFSDYCIQEQDTGQDLRSLIFMEDGHLYTKWDAPGSIIL
jgi:hypothetical protein